MSGSRAFQEPEELIAYLIEREALDEEIEEKAYDHWHVLYSRGYIRRLIREARQGRSGRRGRYDAAVADLLAEGRKATDENVADRLNVTDRQIRQWRADGDIPNRKRGPNSSA